MDEKLNIQDLIDMLAEKHGMSKRNADGFVKEFFQLIEDALETDKYVKIKGLGTFKLIEVESRESINVNTRERFEIQGHTKVSFTPDAVLKDIVNKPFSYFESVPLNNETIFEDILLENENGEEREEPESASPETTITLEETDNIEHTMPAVEADIPEKADTFERTYVAGDMNTPEEPSFSESPVITGKKDASDSSTMRYFISIIILAILLCGGAVAFIYNPNLFEKFVSKPLIGGKSDSKIDDSANKGNTVLAGSAIVKEVAEEMSRTDTVEAGVNALFLEQISKEEAISEPFSIKEKKKVTMPFEPDSIEYTIIGTETVYTVQEGETLTKIALRFYGTKTLWPYIVRHNQDVIKSPDNIPYGTTIKIPRLAKKQ